MRKHESFHNSRKKNPIPPSLKDVSKKFAFDLTFCVYFAEYEVAFDKFATDGILQYNDIKKFFESVGHVPSQKEIDEAIEIVTKSKIYPVMYSFFDCNLQLFFFLVSKVNNPPLDLK